MNIKSLLLLEESDDSFPIPSIDKSAVKRVGPVSGEEGRYQIVTIASDAGDFKVWLKAENLFLDASNPPTHLSFMAGPPHQNKPTGLIFRWVKGAGRVNVTGKAIMKMHNDTQEEDVQQSPATAGRAGGVEADAQLTEEDASTDIPEGPSDDHIRTSFLKKLHVHRIVEQMNRDNFNAFSESNLHDVTVGIIMDCIHAGLYDKILPKVVHKSEKKKFAPIEKKHNPEPDNEEEHGDAFDEWLSSKKKESWYNTPNSKGDKIGDVLADPKRRPAAMLFMITRKANNSEISAKVKDMYEALLESYNDSPSAIQTMLTTEAVMQDQAVLNNVKWDKSTDDMLLDLVSKALTAFQGDLKITNTRGIAMKYFRQDDETRLNSVN